MQSLVQTSRGHGCGKRMYNDLLRFHLTLPGCDEIKPNLYTVPCHCRTVANRILTTARPAVLWQLCSEYEYQTIFYIMKITIGKLCWIIKHETVAQLWNGTRDEWYHQIRNCWLTSVILLINGHDGRSRKQSPQRIDRVRRVARSLFAI